MLRKKLYGIPLISIMKKCISQALSICTCGHNYWSDSVVQLVLAPVGFKAWYQLYLWKIKMPKMLSSILYSSLWVICDRFCWIGQNEEVMDNVNDNKKDHQTYLLASEFCWKKIGLINVILVKGMLSQWIND